MQASYSAPARGGERISPRTKLALVAIAAAVAIVVVVVGLASLAPTTKPASVNEPPVARFDYKANNLTVVFNASASNDPDGSIANYSWTFGDDTEWFGQVVTHIYSANGTYATKLTVTDNGGAKNSTSKDVSVNTTSKPPVTNKPPTAVIKIVSISDFSVSVSGEDSTSAPGTTISSYAWTFGDGGKASGVNATHTYVSTGVFTITLTVKDSAGQQDTASVEVAIPPGPPPVTKLPVPVIRIVSIVNLTVSLSGSGSTPAPETTITAYAWSFGDGATATGVNVTHTYERNGTYTVTLTVTDSDGGKNSTSVEVTVSAAAPPPPPPHPHPDGPPGLLHAIEIHQEKADRNGGLTNSLQHLEKNLDRWLEKFGTSP